MARVVSINTSAFKGTVKKPVCEAYFEADHGIEGDAHSGKWHRQVSLLATESVDQMRNDKIDLVPGIFAENITTEGIDLKNLKIGTKLKIGDVIMEVTQIGKSCHNACEIRNIVGDCVMPREGIFTKVLKSGVIKVDDEIATLED